MLIPPGFALVRWLLRVEGDNEPMNVTCGVETDLSTWSMEELAARAFTNYADFMMPGHQTQYTLVGTSVSFGQDGPDPITIDHAGSVAGTNGSSPLPQNCAILVRKNTAMGGRRNRGRMFLPGFVGEGSVEANGDLTPATLTNRQTLLDGFYEAMSEEGVGFQTLAPVILHETGSPTPAPVTSFAVQPRIATQRRRLRP